MWRDLRLGLGFTTEDNGVANTLMDGLVDWDEKAAELCKSDQRIEKRSLDEKN